MKIARIQASFVTDVLPQLFFRVNELFAVETIQGRKLFKCGNYMSKYGSHYKLELVDEGEI